MDKNAERQKKANPSTLEQQLKDLGAEIETCQQKIREAKGKKKGLTERKKKRDLESLYELIRNSGKSMEEVLQLF